MRPAVGYSQAGRLSAGTPHTEAVFGACLPPSPLGAVTIRWHALRRCGPEKGAILEELVAAQQPALAVELGTFMG